MLYDLKDQIVKAYMIKMPLLIVEGHDDIRVYSEISKIAKKNVDIIAIENFNKYSEGCEGVLSALKDLQPFLRSNTKLLNYILGIVDRDARKFRNELPKNVKGIFVLKYYSFETHFLTKNHVQELLKKTTKLPQNYLKEETINFVYNNFIKNLERLYYASLEALKKAIHSSYNAEITYECNAGRIFEDDALYDRITKKKADLDKFAQLHKLKYNLNSLKKVAKGKWILYFFARIIHSSIKRLPEECKNKYVFQCQYCMTGRFQKCLYRQNATYQLDSAQQIILSYLCKQEMCYIIDRFKKLA